MNCSQSEGLWGKTEVSLHVCSETGSVALPGEAFTKLCSLELMGWKLFHHSPASSVNQVQKHCMVVKGTAFSMLLQGTLRFHLDSVTT